VGGAGGKRVLSLQPCTVGGAGGEGVLSLQPCTVGGAGGVGVLSLQPCTVRGAVDRGCSLCSPDDFLNKNVNYTNIKSTLIMAF
jgi:hypothetical protein